MVKKVIVGIINFDDMLLNIFSGLRARLMLLVFLAVIPALGWILYTSAEQRQTSTNEVRAEADFVAQITAKDQENNIAETRKLLLTLAHLSEVRNEDSQACSSLFAKLLEQFPQYANLGVLKPDGSVLCSGFPLQKPVSFLDKSYFLRARDEYIFAASDFEIDQVTDLPTITFAYPVITGTGEVESVVFATFNLLWLNQQSIGAQLPEGASMIMVDRNNTILAQFPNPEDWIGQTVPASSELKNVLGQSGAYKTLPGLDGLLRFYAFKPLRTVTDTGYIIGVGISEADALAQANERLLRDLALLGVVFLLALAAAWFGGDLFILRRVRNLLNVTQRVSRGDLQVRTGLPYGNGELSQLARSFDDMTEALQQREEERYRAEQEIIRHNRDLAALNTVTATVSSSLKLPEILESLKNLLVEQLEVPGGAIFFYDENTDMLHVETAWGVPAAIFYELKRFPADTLHYKHVVRENKTIFNRDLRQVIPFSILGLDAARPDWHSYICVPLISKGSVQGVLDLFSRAPVEFTQENVQLFTALGQQVGISPNSCLKCRNRKGAISPGNSMMKLGNR
jgi:HAMP domain-containing protein